MNKGDTVMVAGSFTVDEWAPQDGTHSTPGPKCTDLRIWAHTIAVVSRKQAQAAGYASAAPDASNPAAAVQAQPAPEPWETYTEPGF